MDFNQAILSCFSLQSANPIEQRTATALLKSYFLLRFLLRQSHLFICSLPQIPYCIWYPWTRIICPEGDLHHHGFLLKNDFQQTCGKLKGQKAGPRPVGRPPSRCQTPWTEGDCLQMASLFGTSGEQPCGRHNSPTLPRPCRACHGPKFGRETCQILSARLSISFHAFCLNLSSWKMGLLLLYSYSYLFQNTCPYVSVYISTISQQDFMKHYTRVTRINKTQSLSSAHLLP